MATWAAERCTGIGTEGGFAQPGSRPWWGCAPARGCGDSAGSSELRVTAAKAGGDVEERMARAKASLEEVNQKWARVQPLVTDRCN